jgi:hypothetical protein
LFKFFQTLFSAQASEANALVGEPEPSEPPAEIAVAGLPAFAISSHLSSSNGLPFLDWVAVQAWVDAMDDAALQARAWAVCERAWLERMLTALGPSYRLVEESDVILLSTLEANVARATLGFVVKTLKKITILLDGIAYIPEWGKDILIVFDDEDTYYRYVSHYYPEAGEFAGSSGMYINSGCGHFVTVKADLRAIEPVIAHELTHSCVSHLPIPAWLNEGLAVNTEHRLSPPGPSVFTPRQMHEKHRQFWGETEIQEFWSGKSFLRNDDANMLSYDLARIIVAQLSEDWTSFRAFVLDTNLADAGAAAALAHLGMDLGAVACTLLEKAPHPAWAPNPAAWNEAPEHGAF